MKYKRFVFDEDEIWVFINMCKAEGYFEVYDRSTDDRVSKNIAEWLIDHAEYVEEVTDEKEEDDGTEPA